MDLYLLPYMVTMISLLLLPIQILPWTVSFITCLTYVGLFKNSVVMWLKSTIVDQICLVSKDCSSVLKQLHCCFIIFAFTISAPQDMRSVELAVTVNVCFFVYLGTMHLAILEEFFHDCMVYYTLGNHAVRSCFDFAEHTGGICWWLSGSSRRCTWFLWVRSSHILW